MMVKQYIIVNKSLNMSHGKMAAQVAHASSAYFTSLLKKGVTGYNEEKKVYTGEFSIPETIWTHWINGIFTKVCLEVKSVEKLGKVCERLENEGFIEGEDYFKIVDVGSTEFNGIPHWTCIGIRPIDSEDDRIKRVLKGLQVYKG